MRKSLIISLLFFIGLFHRNAFAQTVFLQTTVPITIPTVLDLQITANTATSANFNSTATLDNGITFSNGTTLTYKSNKAYFITINSQTANFTGGSNPAMPASVIGYKLHTNPTYVALSSTAANLVGALGSESTRGTGTWSIDFLVNPGYLYPAATNYSITIVYTISNL